MNEAEVKRILESYRTVAVVGLSRNPAKASYRVSKYLDKEGYLIIPINPVADKILDRQAYKSLLHIPPEIQKTIEIVDIFRPSEEVGQVVDDAVQIRQQHGKPYVIWMQLGITNHDAAEKAKKAGLGVVMNKCMMKEHNRLFAEKDPELERIHARKRRELIERAKGDSKISTPITMDDGNFTKTVESHPFVVVDCWAAWCGPCRMIAPLIDELAEEYAGRLVFGKLNVDENVQTATRYNIMGIPTLIVLKNGVEVDRIVGAASKESIKGRLEKHL